MIPPVFYALPQLLRYGLWALLVLFISLFFPQGNTFKYDFAIGERWRYDEFKAPFAFPIEKSEEELSRDRRRITDEFIPYYRYDPQVALFQQDSLERILAELYGSQKDNPSIRLADTLALLKIGKGLLQHFYAKRILVLDSLHLRLPKNQQIFWLLVDAHTLADGVQTSEDYLSVTQVNHALLDTLAQLRRSTPVTQLLFDALRRSIQPNIRYAPDLTEKFRQKALASIQQNRGMVAAGERIVSRDEPIDSAIHAKLRSFQRQYEKQVIKHKSGFLVYVGYLLLTVALLSIYAVFVRFYAPEVFQNTRHMGLLVVLIAGYAYVAFTVSRVPHLEQYIIPFCIIPIVVQNFFSSQLALFTHIVVVLITSMLLSLDYQFILVQIIVGMVAVLTKLKTRYLSDFFISLLYIGVAYAAGFLSLELIHTGAIFPVKDTQGHVLSEGVRWEMLGWIGFNVCLTLLSYPLIPLLERVFGLTSEITLVELSDLHTPLLHELGIRAPGTLQHSLQVANLAEAAAIEIGANALLVKVGALYHDIGKMTNPSFFIENQDTDNPHGHLSAQESALKIIAHVHEGVRLARKYRLPTAIIDFILTHHGTTRVEYFYRKCLDEQNGVAEELFRYPGPRPRNREEAIVMIADSLEAASKSLKNPTGYDIDLLVDNIIRGKIAGGQLDDTNLTFAELEQIKQVFRRMLRSIHHVRIEYPKDQATAD